MNKKQIQLGMNPSTAQGRLLKDLLFDFAVKDGHTCFRCGGMLSRDTFSVEHIKPWLDSEDPRGLFFDIDNIAYSHLSCNVGARRQGPMPMRGYTHGESGYRGGCRCAVCKSAYSSKRRRRYIATGR